MYITMVKKRLSNGDDCRKCAEAEAMLRNRGMWDQVDRVVWADEADHASEGWQLSREFDVDNAPFFVVKNGAPAPSVYSSVLRFMRAIEGDGREQRREARQDEAPEDLDQLNVEFADRDPLDILKWGLTRFGEGTGLAFSGAEDVALIDMAVSTGLPFSVFCLDTGRLHAETYRFIEKVRTHYGIEIEMMMPDASKLQPFVRKKGLFSFYEDGHQECCGVRKIEPLRRALSVRDAWVTGQRKDQSPSTRASVPVIQQDPAFQGKGERLVKLNPLANWSSAQVWQYLRDRDVPFNPLHEKGFISIGCEPCTRPTHPGQHEREGRWWWEESTIKECGLHSAVPAVPAESAHK